MAVIAVTKDTPTEIVANVNRDMDVSVDCTSLGFSVYVQAVRAGIVVSEWKVRFGASAVIPFLRNDQAVARPVGTGNVTVNIL